MDGGSGEFISQQGLIQTCKDGRGRTLQNPGLMGLISRDPCFRILIGSAVLTCPSPRWRRPRGAMLRPRPRAESAEPARRRKKSCTDSSTDDTWIRSRSGGLLTVVTKAANARTRVCVYTCLLYGDCACARTGLSTSVLFRVRTAVLSVPATQAASQPGGDHRALFLASHPCQPSSNPTNRRVPRYYIFLQTHQAMMTGSRQRPQRRPHPRLRPPPRQKTDLTRCPWTSPQTASARAGHAATDHPTACCPKTEHPLGQHIRPDGIEMTSSDGSLQIQSIPYRESRPDAGGWGGDRSCRFLPPSDTTKPSSSQGCLVASSRFLVRAPYSIQIHMGSEMSPETPCSGTVFGNSSGAAVCWPSVTAAGPSPREVITRVSQEAPAPRCRYVGP